MSKAPRNNPNPVVELLEPSDYGEYLLHHRGEIVQLLRQLRERGSQISIFFNGNSDLILSMLLEVDDDGVTLDCGGSDETNRRAENAAPLFCVTSLDRVKIQFTLPGLKSIHFQGRPAFRAPLPENVLRLQRREFYRLTLPAARRLSCQIPLGDGGHIEAEVLDLSGGGLAMVAPPDRLLFEPGMAFPGCRMELPEIGIITAVVQVLTVFEITLSNGAHVKRAGCKFTGMPGTMTNLIQRYIIKTERERKAYENGLL